MAKLEGQRRVPQQKRSQQRMDAILDAAAALFAQDGYENTSTNAIAAQAGVSIGSLYQYFGNKEAIVRVLADRYLEQMQALHTEVFHEDVYAMPLSDMLDRMIDPFVRFHLEHPAFGHMMLGSDVSAELADATAAMDEAVVTRIGELIRIRVPGIPGEEADRMALVCKLLVKSLFALLESTPDPDEQARMVAEVKRLFTLYIEDAG